MTPDELEDLAMVGAVMPDGLSSAEVGLFGCFRALHGSHRCGMIDREQGKREKRRLLRIYDSLMLDDALIRHNVRLWVEVEGPAGDFAKARKAGKTQEALEAADRMWQVLYRMPPPKKEENEHGFD